MPKIKRKSTNESYYRRLTASMKMQSNNIVEARYDSNVRRFLLEHYRSTYGTDITAADMSKILDHAGGFLSSIHSSLERAKVFRVDAFFIGEWAKEKDLKSLPVPHDAPYDHCLFEFDQTIVLQFVDPDIQNQYEEQMGKKPIKAILVTNVGRLDGKGYCGYTCATEDYSLSSFAFVRDDDGEYENLVHYTVVDGWEPVEMETVHHYMSHKMFGIIREILAYIDSPSVIIEENDARTTLERYRNEKGKKEPEPYYTCRLVKQKTTTEPMSETGEGTKHSFRYDVRSHTRRLKDGRVIRVKAHKRGPEDSPYIPKAYRIG